MFPKDWPANCPPPDAGDSQGPVYRIVAQETPREEDFLSYAELDLAPDAPACRRHGLSVYRSRREACHQLALRPYLGARVSEGALLPAHGKMKLTSPATGHICWWPAEGIRRTSLFAQGGACP